MSRAEFRWVLHILLGKLAAALGAFLVAVSLKQRPVERALGAWDPASTSYLVSAYNQQGYAYQVGEGPDEP